MSLLSKRAFYSQFPGPFTYTEGSDGVDDTFDVVCLTSHAYLFSTYFWQARARAELAAACICTALNAPLLGHNADDVWNNMLEFFMLYAPPYRSRRTVCEYRGTGYEVFSGLGDQCVIFLPGRTRQNRLVARQIAVALTALVRSACEIPASEVPQSDMPEPVQCLASEIV